MTTTDHATATTTLADGPPDPEAIGAFMTSLIGSYVGAATTMLIDVGSRTGLFDALLAGPATSVELADRAGLSERHVREWLGGATACGLVEVDAATHAFTLPAAHAVGLTGESSANLAPLARTIGFMSRHVGAVVRTLEEGGGIPYAEYRPEFTTVQDGISRHIFDDALVDGYVPAVPGLAERLRAGATVADVGCGSGHAVNVLAAAFPAATVVGYDLDEGGILAARAEAEAMGLRNARFEVRDVTSLPAGVRYDVVLAIDAIHDQARPRDVLRGIRGALADDGVFVMVDMDLPSDVAQVAGNPMAAWAYTVSLFHCMQVSLAEGGEGLGAAWGRERALDLLAEAGFDHVELRESPPQDPINVIYDARP